MKLPLELFNLILKYASYNLTIKLLKLNMLLALLIKDNELQIYVEMIYGKKRTISSSFKQINMLRSYDKLIHEIRCNPKTNDVFLELKSLSNTSHDDFLLHREKRDMLESLFQSACRDGLIKLVEKMMVEYKINVYANCNISLYEAIIHKHYQLIKILINNKAIINSGYIMRLAVIHLNVNFVRYLKSKGGNLHEKGAFIASIVKDDIEMVEFFLDNGFEITSAEIYSSRSKKMQQFLISKRKYIET